MQNWDRDTHDAIVWVRQNRHLFKMEVFETPYMRMSVKDARYTDALESVCGGSLKVCLDIMLILSLNTHEVSAIYLPMSRGQ